MEAFEQFVAVSLEAERYVVSGSVKFPVKRRVNKTERVEVQTHGYEVDLIGARADSLVLATVKSFFGSRGVQAAEVTGKGGSTGLYRLLNDRVIRAGVIKGAAERYGYREDQVSLRLYAGKFAGRNGADREPIERWCQRQRAGKGAIEVVPLESVVSKVREASRGGTYLNNSIIVSLKVLAAAGLLKDDAVDKVNAEALHELGDVTE